MILRINNELVTCFHDVENACMALDDCDGNDGNMNMTVFRKVSCSISSSFSNFFLSLGTRAVLY